MVHRHGTDDIDRLWEADLRKRAEGCSREDAVMNLQVSYPDGMIRVRHIGPEPGIHDIGDWLFVEPVDDWEFRISGQFSACWKVAKDRYGERYGTCYGIIDCVKLK
jgi:hypothetical protein